MYFAFDFVLFVILNLEMLTDGRKYFLEGRDKGRGAVQGVPHMVRTILIGEFSIAGSEQG